MTSAILWNIEWGYNVTEEILWNIELGYKLTEESAFVKCEFCEKAAFDKCDFFQKSAPDKCKFCDRDGKQFIDLIALVKRGLFWETSSWQVRFFHAHHTTIQIHFY